MNTDTIALRRRALQLISSNRPSALARGLEIVRVHFPVTWALCGGESVGIQIRELRKYLAA